MPTTSSEQAESGAGSQASVSPSEASPDSNDTVVSDAAQGAASRWQDQCFLIDGWEVLADKYESKAFYRNVIPVGGYPSQVISILANEPDAGTFFKLSPAQLSFLVPTIKLYVLDYDVKDGRHVEGALREIIFDDFTQEADVQNIFANAAGRGHGAGIKSFSYTFDGKDPATIDRSIGATLKMLFTDTEIMTRVQPSGVSFIDLVTRINKQVPNKSSYNVSKKQDLSNPSSFCVKPKTKAERAKTSPTMTVLNPEYRRIKAKIGWAIPRGANAENFFNETFLDGGSRQGLVNLLERMQLELFLEMTTHSMDFKNDGRIELTVNYRASLEGEMLSPEANLFFDLQEQINQAKNISAAAVDAASATLDATRAIVDTAGMKSLDQDELAAAAEAEKVKKSAEADVNLQTDMLKYRVYQQFLEKLILGGNVWSVDVKGDDLKAWMGGNTDSLKKKTDYAKARSAGSNRLTANKILSRKNTKISKGAFQSSAYDAVMGGLKAASKEGDPDDPVDSRKDAADEVKDAQEEIAEQSSEKGDIEDKTINYLFFGDILDVAMTTFTNNVEKVRDTKIRMMVSKMTFINPATGKLINAKITDIPIALDEFVIWYTNHVIKPMRSQYKILNFIQDIMTQLVAQALGYNCFEGMGNLLPELSLVPIQYPLTDKGSEPIQRGTAGAPSDRFPRVSVNNLRKIFSKDKKTNAAATSYVSYLVMHASLKSAANRDPSNIELDERNGIYHLGIGLDRGIVKNIKFKASKIKHHAEARIIDQGMANLGQLYEKYDASVEMYGCSLFKTGQHIYINPRTMGVTSDISRLLGLGGYYIITKVTGELSSTGYGLTLDAKFENNGLCGAKGEQPPEDRPDSDTSKQVDHLGTENLGATPGEKRSSQSIDPNNMKKKLGAMPSRGAGVKKDSS